MSFFSNDPSASLSQYSMGVSSPSLPRTGTPSDAYIDPTMAPGAGRNTLQTSGYLDPTQVQFNAQGQPVNVGTGTLFNLSPDQAAALKGATNAGSPTQSGVGAGATGPAAPTPADVSQVQQPGSQAAAVIAGLQKLGKIAADLNLGTNPTTGTEAQPTTGTDISNFLPGTQNNITDKNLSLNGAPLPPVSTQSPQDLAAQLANPPSGLSKFNLGVDTNLDVSAPTTSAVTGTESMAGAANAGTGMPNTPPAAQIAAAPQTPAAAPAPLPNGQPDPTGGILTGTQSPDAVIAPPGSPKSDGSVMGLGTGAVQAIGGLYQVYNSLQPGGTVPGGVGGGLQAVGGVVKALQSLPTNILDQLGITQSALSLIGRVGGTVGGLGGLLGIAEGIQSATQKGGNVVGGIIQAVQGAGAAAVGLETVAPELVQQLVTELSTLAPELVASIASSVAALSSMISAVTGIASGAVGATTGLVGAASALAGIGATSTAAADPLMAQSDRAAINALNDIPVVGGFLAAFTDLVMQNFDSNGNFINNPIVSALYSGATQSVQAINQVGTTIDKIGITNVPTTSLLTALPSLLDGIAAQYRTAQGAVGPVGVGDFFRGSNAGLADAYNKSWVQAHQLVTQITEELLNRGVTYDQIGQSMDALAARGINPWDTSNPANFGMDIGANAFGGTLASNLLAGSPNKTQLDAVAQNFMDRINNVMYGGTDPNFVYTPAGYRGSSEEGGGVQWSPAQLVYNDPNTGYPTTIDPTQLTEPNLLTLAATQVDRPWTMMGGMPWYAIELMGADPTLQAQIEQHFNPWVTMSTMPDVQLAETAGPFLGQYGFGQAPQTMSSP